MNQKKGIELLRVIRKFIDHGTCMAIYLQDDLEEAENFLNQLEDQMKKEPVKKEKMEHKPMMPAKSEKTSMSKPPFAKKKK